VVEKVRPKEFVQAVSKPTTQVNVFYGATGTGKSTQHANIARWIYDEQPFGPDRRYTKLVLCDMGGLEAWEELIQLGIVEVLDIHQWAVKGGKMGPHGMMDGVIRQKWLPIMQGVDENGKPVGTVQMSEHDWSKTGYVVVESLHGLGQAMATFLESIAFKPVGDKDAGINYFASAGADEDIPVGGGGWGTINLIQNTIINQMQGLATLPVPLVGVSAHENRGTDNSMSKEVVFGPMVYAKAATPRVFNNAAMSVHFDIGEQGDYRAYLTPHMENQAKWNANPRLPVYLAEEFKAKYPGGFIALDAAGKNGVHTFIKWKLQRQQERVQQLKKKMENTND
jgi:hypothetical protein